jgi:uroporphyrinogen-III synthase
MRRVLVLRPEPGATVTAERARGQGLDAVVLPLFEVEPVDAALPDATRFDALLLTSANAVRFGGEVLKRLQSLPVHAVGQATAAAASDAGFEIASSGEAGVDQLLRSIEPGARLLHLCGEDRRPPTDPRQEITSVAVYRSAEIPDPDLSVGPGSVALVHSPRAGRHFAELIDRAGINRGSIAIAAISAVAAGAVGSGWESIDAAESADDAALLALAARLCQKPGGE